MLLAFISLQIVNNSAAQLPQSPRAGSMGKRQYIERKRDLIWNPTELKDYAGDFGKLVDENLHEKQNLYYEMNWNRIIAEGSSYTGGQCELELELDCFLSDDHSVSFLC